MKLFIFGSTGDLIKRKVLPALQKLDKKDLEIYAIGRREFNNEIYQDFVCKDKCNKKFKEKLNYIQIDYDSNEFCESCFSYLSKSDENYFYIALPPNLYPPLLNFFGKLKNKGYQLKILIEKPFGNSLYEAKKLKELAKKNNILEDIFISDHYLFKKGALNLKKTDFNELTIKSIEKLGMEGRITYYDNVGAIRDMIQSHLLNILFRVVLNKKDLMNYKIQNTIIGQYGDGNGEGYIKELGKKSNTETFAYISLKNKDKKINLVTGKKLDKKTSEIEIDGEKISLEGDSPYTKLFNNFLNKKKDLFPSIEDTIFAWELIQKFIENKSKLKYYREGSKLKEVLEK